MENEPWPLRHASEFDGRHLPVEQGSLWRIGSRKISAAPGEMAKPAEGIRVIDADAQLLEPLSAPADWAVRHEAEINKTHSRHTGA